jgi:Zn-dependent M28 family amino/carboxypeptidase
LFAIVAALLAACGGTDAPRPSESTSDTALVTTATPTSSPAATPPTTQTPLATVGSGGAAFDGLRAYDHVVALAGEIGRRVAGTEGEALAADYIEREFKAVGYDATVEPFSFAGFVDNGSEVVDRSGRVYRANALEFSAGGDVTAPAFDAGLGYPGDFTTAAGGAIAVIQRGEIEFAEKVANAAAAGAVGAVIVNNEADNFRGSLGAESAIPAASISQADGGALLEAARAGDIRLRVDAAAGTIESRNVVAREPGGSCEIVAGGHFDAVPAGPGANDNASGTGAVLELARVLRARGLADRVCLVAFGGEEQGLHGSKAFVAALSDDERAEIDAMVNFDMVGVGTTWSLIGSPELVGLASDAARAFGFDAVPAEMPAGSGSDHASFAAVGIPVLFFYAGTDPDYHQATDVPENVSPEHLAEAGAMGLAVIEALLTTEA